MYANPAFNAANPAFYAANPAFNAVNPAFYAANSAFNARPNGAKAPSPGQASAVSGTPGFARTRPIRPNGAKAATGAFKSSARKHSSCCPAPRAPPHTYNKSRAHARVYT